MSLEKNFRYGSGSTHIVYADRAKGQEEDESC